MKKLFALLLFLLPAAASAYEERTEGIYPDESSAVAACTAGAQAAGVSGCTGHGDYLRYRWGDAQVSLLYHNYYFDQCPVGEEPTYYNSGDYAGTGELLKYTCAAPPSATCTANVTHFLKGAPSATNLPASLCLPSGSGGCAVTRQGPAVQQFGTWSALYSESGGTCTPSGSPSATVTEPPQPVPGSDCTKTTLLNGSSSYDCGKTTSTGGATGVHCEQTAEGYKCSGGDSNTTCWTDATGTINCIGKGATQEGTATTTPIKTDRSKKTNPDGTTSETKTEYLPGGGWSTTTTNYDAQGNPTGTTKESGSGLENNDGQGGDGNGTTEPPAEPPSGTLPNNTINIPGFTQTAYVTGTASCPAPVNFTVAGHSMSVAWTPFCDYAAGLRYIVLVLAFFLAVKIFQGYVNEATA